LLRSKEEIQDLKKGHHRLGEEKKIAAVLLAYSSELRRWEMNTDLANWLTGGANANPMKRKDEDATSKVIFLSSF
jgi:hypothetical protein